MIEDLLQEIKHFANPIRAEADQRYHKSKREHWGVTAPHCNLIAKKVSNGLKQEELLAITKELWATDLFDPMMCASKILSLPAVKPSPAVWKVITSFLKNVDGWALEDGLARIAGKCIQADEKLLDEVENWTTHPNFWMRRAALVYTLPYAKRGKDPERMLRWASLYSTDPEWFIQKAIGWWLRVLGEHNPDRVLLFLEGHWPQLKAVARKEATRKLILNEIQQKAMLQIKSIKDS